MWGALGPVQACKGTVLPLYVCNLQHQQIEYTPAENAVFEVVATVDITMAVFCNVIL